MIDTLEQPARMQLPDHGEPSLVSGRGVVMAYEKDLMSEHIFSEPTEDKEFWLNYNLNKYKVGLNALTKDKEANAAIDTYFDSFTTLPPILRKAKKEAEEAAGLRDQGSRGGLTWSEWLAEGASNEQLLNFLQWHNHTHENRGNDPAVAEAIERLKDEYEAKVIPAMTAGFLHPDALFAKQRLRGHKIVFSDIFNAYLATLMGSMDPYGKKIEISEDAPTNHPQTIWHEFSHAGLGEYDDRDKNLWIDEALTEHISLALQFGEWEVVDPDKRKDKTQFYSLERKLLAQLTEVVPIQLFTRYYSAMTKEAREYAKANLDAALELATGQKDVIRKISEYLISRSNNLISDDEIDIDFDDYNTALKELAEDPSLAWSFAASLEGKVSL